MAQRRTERSPLDVGPDADTQRAENIQALKDAAQALNDALRQSQQAPAEEQPQEPQSGPIPNGTRVWWNGGREPTFAADYVVVGYDGNNGTYQIHSVFGRDMSVPQTELRQIPE